MADIAKKQVEKEEIREISDSKLSDYDRELQQALREYVPGSDEEKKLLSKIDPFLMPCLWIMYILSKPQITPYRLTEEST